MLPSASATRAAAGPRALRSRPGASGAFAWPPSSHSCRRSGSLASRPRGQVAAKASPETQERKDPATATIEELDVNYCDDFECTSSPAVEQTVRALARDLARGAYTRASFQPDATYEDGYRSFKGSERLSRAMWARSVLQIPKLSVTRMRMLDKGTAEISWKAEGQVAVFLVTVPVKTVVTLNLLTGRVTSLKESWDLSGLSAPASAALVASRVSWSAQQTSKDAQEGISKTLESLGSMASVDEDQVYRDPSDPTRFFRQEDSTMNDAIALCMLLAVLYAAWKAYSILLGA